MSVTFNQASFTADQSTTGVYALGNFTGTAGLSGTTPVSINGTVDQPGSVVQVDLSVGGVTNAGAQGTYLGYSAIPNTTDYVYYFEVTGANLQTPVTIGVTAEANLPVLSSQPVDSSPVTAPKSGTPFCFAAGTRILTSDGYRAIEDLKVGDMVRTASGKMRAIIWLGQRTVDCSRELDPNNVLPIRVRAGAFAPNKPERDIRMSRGHRLFINHALVTLDRLVNGWSIVRECADEMVYWHLELEEHDVVIAEGLPAESYIEAGNRRAFEPDGCIQLESADLDGEVPEEDLCAPLLEEGPELVAIRRALLSRARLFGACFVEDCGIQLSADGVAITPMLVNEDCFMFQVPVGTRTVRLLSRSSVASEVQPESLDHRTLGVMISDLTVDGQANDLSSPAFTVGWHQLEICDGRNARWTSGNAPLPVGRIISFRVMKLPVYRGVQTERTDAPATRTETRLRAVA